jgi:hypothetical protein
MPLFLLKKFSPNALLKGARAEKTQNSNLMSPLLRNFSAKKSL